MSTAQSDFTLAVSIRTSFVCNLFYYQSDGTTPVNLTGYTAQLDARDANGNLIISLSTSNSGIAITGPTGLIALSISATDTASLPLGSYSYDLLINAPDSGPITKILQGVFFVADTITEES